MQSQRRLSREPNSLFSNLVQNQFYSLVLAEEKMNWIALSLFSYNRLNMNEVNQLFLKLHLNVDTKMHNVIINV